MIYDSIISMVFVLRSTEQSFMNNLYVKETGPELNPVELPF